jgi:ribosome-associated heat shock protein Hsp15
MSALTTTRIDKWLWAIRIFKTRTLASDACKAGRVKINGKSIKASYMVKIGETVTVQKGQEKFVLKAVSMIEKRVGAPIAVKCYEDFSPPPIPKNPHKLDGVFYDMPVAQRKRGEGRPTKRERRKLDGFKE